MTFNPSLPPSPPSYQIMRAYNGSYFEQFDWQSDKRSSITINEDPTLLSDGTYSYRIKAYSHSDCDLESDWSNIIDLIVLNGEWVNINYPTTPVTNLRLQLLKDGKFLVKWDHIPKIDDVSPEHFNIYSSEDNDSGPWTLEDAVEYITFGLLTYIHTTSGYTHGQVMYFRVFPSISDENNASIQNENTNDLTVGGTADAKGPIVVNDIISIT